MSILQEYRDPWIRRVLKDETPYGYKVAVFPSGSPPFQLERLGPWQRAPEADHCWLRTIVGGNPKKISDRRVFVEKTPRVYDASFGLPPEDFRAWIQGNKGEADEGEGLDPRSRKWADEFARALGYELTE